MPRMPLLELCILFLLSVSAVANDNGLARHPPMGWRSWNLFAEHVNQTLIMSIMEGMVKKTRLVDGVPTSLCDLGYCDVGLDDGWQNCKANRALKLGKVGTKTIGHGNHFHDILGNPLVNEERFPDLKAMTDFAHNLGLTAGWYTNNCICRENNTAERKYYEGDVRAFRKYGFDSYKIDACGAQMDLQLYDDVIKADGGKPILVENCHWGRKHPFAPNSTWCPWNFYRTSDDIRAEYSSIVYNLQMVNKYSRKNLSTPGCWAYPDMLEVGVERPGLTNAETRSHFGAWAIVSSPLVLSHDVRNDTVMDEIWPVISNKEALEVSQTYAGFSGGPFKQIGERLELAPQQGRRNAITSPTLEYFYKPLQWGEGKTAVLLINHGNETADLQLDFVDIPNRPCKTCHVRDIWNHENLGVFTGSFVARGVDSHDSIFLVLNSVAESPSKDNSFLLQQSRFHKELP